jgi:hypothetical protein
MDRGSDKCALIFGLCFVAVATEWTIVVVLPLGCQYCFGHVAHTNFFTAHARTPVVVVVVLLMMMI